MCVYQTSLNRVKLFIDLLVGIYFKKLLTLFKTAMLALLGSCRVQQLNFSSSFRLSLRASDNETVRRVKRLKDSLSHLCDPLKCWPLFNYFEKFRNSEFQTCR